MSRYNLISVDAIISKSIRAGLNGVGFSEGDIVEMIGEALEFIGAYGQFEQDIKYLAVSDYKVKLPSGLAEIIQMAYKLEDSNSSDCLPYDETEVVTEGVKDCWASPNEYYIPEQRYYDLIADYSSISRYNSNYYSEYRPLKLDKSTFNASLALHCSQCINLYCTSDHSYSIHNGYINTSFQSGGICISYLKQPVDDRGYPMIPDIISYKEAIVVYLKKVHSDTAYYNDPTPTNERRLAKYEADWHWYCRQAKNFQLIPQNVDEREALFRDNHKMVKQKNAYSNYFSLSNNLERTDWSHDRRRY